jgi:hypothetical protein
MSQQRRHAIVNHNLYRDESIVVRQFAIDDDLQPRVVHDTACNRYGSSSQKAESNDMIVRVSVQVDAVPTVDNVEFLRNGLSVTKGISSQMAALIWGKLPECMKTWLLLPSVEAAREAILPPGPWWMDGVNLSIAGAYRRILVWKNYPTLPPEWLNRISALSVLRSNLEDALYKAEPIVDKKIVVERGIDIIVKYRSGKPVELIRNYQAELFDIGDDVANVVLVKIMPDAVSWKILYTEHYNERHQRGTTRPGLVREADSVRPDRNAANRGRSYQKSTGGERQRDQAGNSTGGRGSRSTTMPRKYQGVYDVHLPRSQGASTGQQTTVTPGEQPCDEGRMVGEDIQDVACSNIMVVADGDE